MEIGGVEMSKVCRNCGSIRVVDAPSGDVSICLACESFFNAVDGKSKSNYFEHITASPEVLAKKLVYLVRDSYNGAANYYWRSTVVDDAWKTKTEAIVATVAKLKEGEK